MKTINAMDKYIIEKVKTGKIEGNTAYELLKHFHARKDQSVQEDTAIIGMACRFPGANHLDAFYHNLLNNQCHITRFPKTRRVDTDPIVGSRNEDVYFKGGFLEEINRFDAGFFRISPHEADLMDPYQRLLLEITYECMEDAGYGGDMLKGSKTGVYMGVDHSFRSILPSYSQAVIHKDMLTMTGSWTSILSSRISYCFDFKGPSIVLDTACSSGLVAVHDAIHAIGHGDCNMALVGGVNLILLPVKNNFFQDLESGEGILSSFDRHAGGTVWGEGIGVLLLKPLSAAVQDGDSIYAVIKGSAVNNDGASNGITAPDAKAQEKVLVEAWEKSGIQPGDLSYIEAHGTGTILGDPIEIKAIQRAFHRYTSKKQFCGIGTAKTNISHTVAASGVAGIMKVAMALRDEMIPASMNFHSPNPFIDFPGSPVYVVDKNTPWKKGERKRLAGVSSFGLSGTNCHIVLEEPPLNLMENRAEGINVMTVSAKTRNALLETLKRYRQYVSGKKEVDVRDLCYTLNTGRGQYQYRLLMSIDSVEALIDKMTGLIDNNLDSTGIPDCYYGFHKVVSNKKPQRREGEVTEREISAYGRNAREYLKEYRERQSKETLEAIAQLYIKGAELDWKELYEGERRTRLHAPAYAYDRQKHWVKYPETIREEPKQKPFYVTEFIEESSKPMSGGTPPKKTILFYSNTAQVQLLEDKLEDRQVFAFPLEINTERPEIAEILHDKKEQDIIFYLPCFQRNAIETAEELDRYMDQLFGNIYRLIHRHCMRGDGKRTLFFVTSDTYGVCGQKPAYPEYAMFSGLARTMVMEGKQIRCKCLDIDADTGMDQWIEEILSGDLSVKVAFRKGTRYVEKLGVRHRETPDAKKIDIRQEGVYIIVGGLGELGLKTARHLANKTRVHLVFINRTEIPPKELWNRIAQQGNEKDKRINTIHKIMEIQKLGSDITCYSCDISNEQQLAKTMNKIVGKYNRIHGIIHCAGMTRGNFIFQKSWDEVKEVVSAKVKGTFLLYRYLRSHPLDFFILYSSVSSLTGFPGLADYASANAYMEAFAEKHQGEKNIFAIRWPAWNNMGMAAGRKGMEGVFHPMEEREALDYLDGCFMTNGRNVIPGQIHGENLAWFLQLYRTFEPDRGGAGEKEEELRGAKEDRKQKELRLKGNMDMDYSMLQNKLGLIWGQVLGLEEVDIYENFHDLGGDSIMGAKLLRELDKEFPSMIGLTDLFAYPSVYEMAAYIDSRKDNKIQHNEEEGIKPAETNFGLNERIEAFRKKNASMEELLEYLDEVREGNCE